MKESKINSITKAQLKIIVDECNNMTEVLVALGYKRNCGSMRKYLKKYFADYNIDTTHFQPYKRTRQKRQCSLDEILIENSPYTNIRRLKDRILEANLLEYKCELCGNEGEWNGQTLTLQLDHKDGDNKNHTLQNLRFLCPNCHSQTATFSGKNGKYIGTKVKCEELNMEFLSVSECAAYILNKGLTKAASVDAVRKSISAALNGRQNKAYNLTFKKI